MKTTVNQFDFVDAFRQAGRENQFTYEGLQALYEYLEEYEEDTGEEIELDVIALCCEFTEYESIQECADNYGLQSCQEEEEDIEEELLAQISNNTQVIIFDTGIIIQDF